MTFKSYALSMSVLIPALFFLVAPVKADTTREIQHLLSFIGQSDCLFIRNGTEHDPKDARKHIEKKYNYLKSRLNSAEEFIQHAASKSSFSGKIYKVTCGDQSLTTEQWLTTALQDYRSVK